ncbi:hypothetical protein HYQ45_011089 [Verticillium longisporum]|uniref:Uncharacterized protein n=1 Tax=Verticillium longisporum TaxID=100787 RepID=A0A8I2ZIN4_VERLO|nr:hypothetical protein HYQ45_011089 [Verticillium longisporum]
MIAKQPYEHIDRGFASGRWISAGQTRELIGNPHVRRAIIDGSTTVGRTPHQGCIRLGKSSASFDRTGHHSASGRSG